MSEQLRPALELQRDVTRLFVRSGASTTIIYRVENTGNMPLEDVRITDALCGAVAPAEDLAPGEYRVYAVTAAITGPCQSAPTVTWLCDGMTYERTLEPLVIALAEDGMEVSLSADAGEAASGEAVLLTASIRNTGNTRLTEIRLADETFGPLGGLEGALEPGEEAEYAFSVRLSDTASFQVSAVARSASGETVQAVSNALVVLSSADSTDGVLTLRAELADAPAPAGRVRVRLTLTNSGSSPLGSVTVSELHAGTVRVLSALGTGDTLFTCDLPAPADGSLRFLAEYVGQGGTTAIVFSLPLQAEASSGGVETEGSDPLIDPGAPVRLASGRSVYGMLVYGILALFAAAAAVFFGRAMLQRRRKRRRREQRLRHMRVLRRNARMDESEWTRTRPHKPVSAEDE